MLHITEAPPNIATEIQPINQLIVGYECAVPSLKNNKLSIILMLRITKAPPNIATVKYSPLTNLSNIV